MNSVLYTTAEVFVPLLQLTNKTPKLQKPPQKICKRKLCRKTAEKKIEEKTKQGKNTNGKTNTS